MAEDVDKAALLKDKQKKSISNDVDHDSGNTGDQSGNPRRRTWAFGTLFMLACVPVIGAGIQYFRNAQISQRHVSATIKICHFN